MKLLLVTQYFWPESFTINDTASALAERGVEIEVLTGKPNYPEGRLYAGYKLLQVQRESYGSVNIVRIPIVTRGNKNPLRLALNYISFIFSGMLLGPWLLRRSAASVILVYCPSPLLQAIPALIIGKLKKIPVVLYVQDLWPESLTATGYVKSRLLINLVSWVVKVIYRQVDLILISSRPFEEPIKRFRTSAPIEYLPNSVDKDLGNPESGEKPYLPVFDDGFCVVFAGNIGSAQAVSVIVDAAQQLIDIAAIKFVMLGSGSELDWMQQQVKDKVLTNLHLMGRFPASTMPYLLSKASALLVTLADQSIFAMTVPNKIQAYMAVGKPIIACLNGEGARLIRDADAGVTVAAEDGAGLAEAVLRLYQKSPEELKRLGSNGQQYYQRNFDRDMLVEQLHAHLKSVSKGSK
jgi:glycosyltransferase involved in cell wall biosynthesis